MYSKTLVVFFLLLVGNLVAAQEDYQKIIDSINTQQLDEVVISTKQMLGSKFKARNRTGSAYYISPIEIKKLGYTDINRMLKAVPGVNLYEEDGYGLRPNISLRGTKAERSEKITLMEDGILAAPAPYAAPAAYYFPNASRMSAVEVLKGSSQVQYGPFTTGGAINMVSTPIPSKFSGKLDASYGTDNTFKTHFNVGDKRKHFGYLVEYLRYQSDGFKNFEDGKGAGFWRNDFLAKFLVKTDNVEGINHSLEFKFGFANEDSDETYVGVSETDFKATPFLSYAGSQMDNMKNRHQQWLATYLVEFSPKFKITTNAYYNTFFRNWYKLNNIKIGATKAENRTIGEILSDPETNSAYFDVLKGTANTQILYTDYERLKDNPGLFVRANNRNYFSRGIQTKADYRFSVDEIYFNNEIGLRFHADEEDRFQWDDMYAMNNGKMELLWAPLHGSSSNKITSANAIASYIFSKVAYRKWTLTTGLRYENIFLKEKDYTTADVRRSGRVRIENTNHVSAIIPSIGVHFRILPELSVFSGIHKGFSPPGVSKQVRTMDKNGNISVYTDKQKPESSINVEAGARLATDRLKVELIGFYNDFSNMLGSDLFASGGKGTLLQFNVGEATVKGAEFMLQYQPIPERFELRMPLQFSYTYTDTKMENSFESNSWGRVFSGDEIPYINKHNFNASMSVEYKWFEANVGIRYNGDMRTQPGQGIIAERQKVPAHTIIDASVKARINKYVSVKVNAINLTNKTYLVSRHPAGLRPGHPFGIFAGVSLQY